MAETYECPADGCEYTGLKDSVLGHYSGKQDDSHNGGYAYARQQLEGGSNDSEKSQDGNSGKGGTTTPQFPTADGGSGAEGYACPECDSKSDVYTADSVLTMYQRKSAVQLAPEHRKALREADAGCVGCGTAFTVGGSE